MITNTENLEGFCMKKILVITPFCLGRVPFYEWLEGSDTELYLLIGEESIHQNMNVSPRFILSKFKEYHYFTNFRKNSLVVQKAVEIIKEHGITHLIGIDEHGLERVGKLRDMFDIPGQRFSSAHAYRNKKVMKTYLKDKVDMAAWEAGNSVVDLIEHVNNFGFPCVYKDVDGAGSIGTKVISSEEKLAGVVADYEQGKEFLVEEFIDGNMYHVDGFYQDGEIKFIWASYYYNDCLSYQVNKPLGSIFVDKDSADLRTLKILTEKVLKNLPSPDATTFHAEFWKTQDGKFVFCEIGSRCGGGGIWETINYSMNIDLWKVHVQAQAGIEPDFENVIHEPEDTWGWYLIPPKKGVLMSLPKACTIKGVEDYQVQGVIGTEYTNPTGSVAMVQQFVTKTNGDKEMKSLFTVIDDWVENQNLWYMNN
ncbi:ATP-grasp domain-containing protein [Vibrio chagasii]|uniref:ATP-grasp domain-containing protein n=2 Tax=Vibrio chagasii TaxID=170679 RepID=A0A7Y3YT38_9VIBR|nr:ATP-grasp domain-containing protein [Vibrio chagasii]